MIVHTETGSVYQIEGLKVRRTGTHDMRRDEDWVDLLAAPEPIVGQPLVMFLEALGEGFATLRRTSRVTGIEDD